MAIMEEIKKIYSQESGIPLDAPDFWNKYSAFRQKEAKEEDEKEPERCPCCGQIV